jgi:HAD superfamily hydrolase (TIGR01549 family)
MLTDKPILLFDCGDTIIDEGTEVKDARGASLDGELIPGADSLIRTLAERDYTLALVADGFVDTFKNLLEKFDLYGLFPVRAISETVGADKPDRRMFETALKALNIDPEDYSRVWMIGNNLERDMGGAKKLGLTTVWLDWAPRRSKIPANHWETPDHTIHTPLELLDLLGEKI